MTRRGARSYSEVKAQKIATDIQAAIISGQYKKGDEIPTTKTYCQAYGVSFATIVRARQIVAQRGYIDVCRGRRTRVIWSAK
jgi:DNA-binding GntR family transcriptional regulator